MFSLWIERILHYSITHTIAGPELPNLVHHGRAVQPSKNEQTLFIVGGQNPGVGNLDKTYQLVCDKTPDSCRWETTEVKLSKARREHVVLPIEKSLASNLCNQ